MAFLRNCLPVCFYLSRNTGLQSTFQTLQLMVGGMCILLILLDMSKEEHIYIIISLYLIYILCVDNKDEDKDPGNLLSALEGSS